MNAGCGVDVLGVCVCVPSRETVPYEGQDCSSLGLSK